jgi:hypothetical protein
MIMVYYNISYYRLMSSDIFRFVGIKIATNQSRLVAIALH